MRNILSRCIDINSQYCPCLLAETNHCVFCSHLKGESLCNCNWSGVCILYEKHWQSNKRTLGIEELPIRIETETEFRIISKFSPDVYKLEFDVIPTLAQQLTKTGSFVFLRRPQDPYFYHFPVGIMKVIGNTLQVIIETIGPKSTRIIADDNHQLLVRGPYYNGILGQPWIDNLTNGKVVLVAGGMGQPPALPIAAKLISNNNVIAILAPGVIGMTVISEELRDLGVEVHDVSSFRNEGIVILRKLCAGQPDLLVSAGPDEQHYAIINMMQDMNINIPMAVTNNATMCCGEGICGSCQKETHDNKTICTCKVQTDFSQLIPY